MWTLLKYAINFVTFKLFLSTIAFWIVGLCDNKKRTSLQNHLDNDSYHNSQRINNIMHINIIVPQLLCILPYTSA